LYLLPVFVGRINSRVIFNHFSTTKNKAVQGLEEAHVNAHYQKYFGSGLNYWWVEFIERLKDIYSCFIIVEPFHYFGSELLHSHGKRKKLFWYMFFQ
jgi:hypothetical protein